MLDIKIYHTKKGKGKNKSNGIKIQMQWYPEEGEQVNIQVRMFLQQKSQTESLVQISPRGLPRVVHCIQKLLQEILSDEVEVGEVQDQADIQIIMKLPRAILTENKMSVRQHITSTIDKHKAQIAKFLKLGSVPVEKSSFLMSFTWPDSDIPPTMQLQEFECSIVEQVLNAIKHLFPTPVNDHVSRSVFPTHHA